MGPQDRASSPGLPGPDQLQNLTRPGLDEEAEGPSKAEVDAGKSSPLWEAGSCSHGRLGAATLGCVCAGEMTPRVWATWLLSTVFLLQAPGCLALSGPDTVTGPVGGSLSVQCRYEEEFRGNKKYWYRSSPRPLTRKIVATTESEREVRNGHVSIRDHPANLAFTVTMERLTEDDEGTYGCGIDVLWTERFVDPTFEVEVIVSPAAAPPWKIFTSTLGSPSSTSLPLTTLLCTMRPETPNPHQHPQSLLSVHFLLLVFLKLPLFLSMLGAVLWVNRPQRGSGRGGPPHSENR